MKLDPIYEPIDVNYYSQSYLRSIGAALVERIRKGKINVIGLDLVAYNSASAGCPSASEIIRLRELCKRSGV